jgi:hypothetical protein
MIPHIPFVKRKVQLFLRVLFAAHRVADGDDGLDEGVLSIERARKPRVSFVGLP